LDVLKRRGEQNINQLAQLLGRDYKNVHTDIQTLHELGLVQKDKNGLVFVPWDEIETHFKLGLAA
jgi:predicted transcriptional regulator